MKHEQCQEQAAPRLAIEEERTGRAPKREEGGVTRPCVKGTVYGAFRVQYVARSPRQMHLVQHSAVLSWRSCVIGHWERSPPRWSRAACDPPAEPTRPRDVLTGCAEWRPLLRTPGLGGDPLDGQALMPLVKDVPPLPPRPAAVGGASPTVDARSVAQVMVGAGGGHSESLPLSLDRPSPWRDRPRGNHIL